MVGSLAPGGRRSRTDAGRAYPCPSSHHVEAGRVGWWLRAVWGSWRGVLEKKPQAGASSLCRFVIGVRRYVVRKLSMAGAGVLAIALVVTACSSAEETADAPTSSAPPESEGDGASVGPDGGTVVSDDGKFTIVVPAGALPSSVELSISTVSPSAVGAEPDLLAGPIYELRPDGTAFDVPVTMTRTLSAGELGVVGDAVPFFHVYQGSGETWVPLSSETSRQGDVIEIRAETSHFSSNVAVSTIDVWGYGLELTMEMTPGSFTAPVGGSEEVDWHLDFPGDLDFYSRHAEGFHSGALADFAVDEAWRGTATCGEKPGSGTFTVRLDGRISDDRSVDLSDVAETPPDIFLQLFFGARAQSEPFTVSAVGNATCTESESEPESEGTTDAASLLQGSFEGSIQLDSILDDSSFESDYLLSVLPQESAEVVLTDEARAIARLVEETVAQLGSKAIPANTIVFSQFGSDGVGQNTYGVAIDLGTGAVRIFTAGAEPSYSEFYIADLTFCPGFPSGCRDVTIDLVTVGGAPDLDIGQVFGDLLPYIEDPGPQSAFPDTYGWEFGGSGDLTRE